MDFQKLIKTIQRTVLSITLISTLFLTLSFILSFDMINGYFEDGILPILFEIAFTLGAILSITSALALDKHKIIKSKNDPSSESKKYVVFAVAISIFAVLFISLVDGLYFTISAVGALAFAVYLLLIAIKEGYKYSHLKLLLLLLSIPFPIAITIENNSILTRHSNSVENILTSIFTIAFLIYILYEGQRLFFEKHSRWHFASMLLLFHTGFSLSTSYLISYMAYAVDERSRFYQMILIFIFSLFAGLEIVLFTKNSDAHTQMEWNEIEAPIEEEQNEFCNSEQSSEVQEETQNEEKTDE